MPWFRVDDRFATHPKALATSLSARGLWVTAGSWSSAHLTDGVVPDHVLASFGGTPELAAELVAAGLWKRRRGGYQFHDWTQCNSSRDEVTAMREKKAAAGRKGGLATQANREPRKQAASKPQANVIHNPPLRDMGNAAASGNSQANAQAGAVARASPVLEPQALSSYRAKTGARGVAAPPRPANPNRKPPWCGVCDQDTRLTGPPDAPYRCEECHPISGRRARQ